MTFDRYFSATGRNSNLGDSSLARRSVVPPWVQSGTCLDGADCRVLQFSLSPLATCFTFLSPSLEDLTTWCLQIFIYHDQKSKLRAHAKLASWSKFFTGTEILQCLWHSVRFAWTLDRQIALEGTHVFAPDHLAPNGLHFSNTFHI